MEGVMCRNIVVPLALACAMVICMSSGMVQGDCTVQNNSGHKVIVVPVSVSVSIEVDVGASVQLLHSQQNCYFKNAASDNQLGPTTLSDGSVYIIVDGAVSGTVDVCLGVYVLGIIQLGLKIFISL